MALNGHLSQERAAVRRITLPRPYPHPCHDCSQVRPACVCIYGLPQQRCIVSSLTEARSCTSWDSHSTGDHELVATDCPHNRSHLMQGLARR